MYNDYKVYGPYKRKDGRKHVVLVKYVNGVKKSLTVSYPKYIMELHLGRYLTEDETVDHDDRDFTNDVITNLVVRKRSEHSKLDAKRVNDVEFNCEECGKHFVVKGGQAIRDAAYNRVKGKRGPFCGRSCAGKASHNIESYRIKTVERTHYYLNK